MLLNVRLKLKCDAETDRPPSSKVNKDHAFDDWWSLWAAGWVFILLLNERKSAQLPGQASEELNRSLKQQGRNTTKAQHYMQKYTFMIIN